MNRIFFAMVFIAFVVTGYRELTWIPPEMPAAAEVHTPIGLEAVDAPDPFTRALFEEVATLDERVDTAHAPAAPPAPKSPMEELTSAMLDAAKTSVNLAISLVGAMTFFLGLMKVAEAGGLLVVIAKLIRPVMVRLFPDVPPDHPAMGAMILNMSANALGLGNAATPFGIKAMQHLDSLNPEKGTATNAMALFLALNTSSVTLLPTGVMVLRDVMGSEDAAGILPTTLFATVVSTSAALIAAKVYQRFVPAPTGTVEPSDAEADLPEEAHAAYPGWVSAVALGLILLAIPLTVVFGKVVSPWIVPGLAVSLLGYGFVNGVPVYEAFVEGAKDGFQVAVKIIPYLVAILVAVGMFRSSGALDILIIGISPLTSLVGMPAEALPMALLRPLSGSGAYGIMTSILQEQGPDSYAGYLVSTLQGSTETTFYVLAVYYGAVQVQKTRHTMAAALTADLFGIIGAILACQLYFTYNGMW